MTSYLIIARYNHQVYSTFEQAERQNARKTAADLFGGPSIYQDQRETEADGQAKVIPSNAPFASYFTYVDAFEYHRIEVDDDSPEAQVKRANLRYGWVGIVSDSNKLDQVIEGIGWPGSSFCSVFDIQILPLEGVFEKRYPNIPPESNREKQLRGLDIYDFQTPAMWDFR